uniref:Uncharacterized protein n=1 Tax=Romanomermis culicivorax TaxID=13658 RepID=A0A915JR00_ROMCU
MLRCGRSISVSECTGVVSDGRRTAVVSSGDGANLLDDDFDTVGSFVVDAAAAYGLREVVQHGPWHSRISTCIYCNKKLPSNRPSADYLAKHRSMADGRKTRQLADASVHH